METKYHVYGAFEWDDENNFYFTELEQALTEAEETSSSEDYAYIVKEIPANKIIAIYYSGKRYDAKSD